MATPASILKNIEDAIRPRIEAAGGQLDVASDLEHALQILGTNPRGWRVVLNWDGYGANEFALSGKNDLNFQIFLHANLGLGTPSGNAIHRDQHGKAAFLSLLETVNQWMRGLRWPNGHNVDCEGLANADSQWVAATPDHTRAHALSYTLGFCHEAPAEIIVIS